MGFSVTALLGIKGYIKSGFLTCHSLSIEHEFKVQMVGSQGLKSGSTVYYPCAHEQFTQLH